MDPEADRILRWIEWVVRVQWLLFVLQLINGGVVAYLYWYGGYDDPHLFGATLLVSITGVGASWFGHHYQSRLGRALDTILQDHIRHEHDAFLQQRRYEIDDLIRRTRYTRCREPESDSSPRS